MKRESFVFHSDFIDHLPPELQAEWAMYCIEYGLNDNEPQFNDVLHAELWRKLKDRIDTDRDSYNQRVSYNAMYNEYKKQLKAGLIPQGTTFENFKTLKSFKSFKTFEKLENFSNISTESRREYDSDSESEYESESEYDFEFKREGEQSSPARSKKQFKKPTLEEIKAYLTEKGYTFSAEAFYNFYESNGWKVGKNPMKSWKAACTTWQERESKDQNFDSNAAIDYNSPEWKQEDW